MNYNSPTSNSFEICSKIFPFFIYCLLNVFYHFMWNINNLSQFKHQQMAKMNDWVPKERLGTSRFNDLFMSYFIGPRLKHMFEWSLKLLLRIPIESDLTPFKRWSGFRFFLELLVSVLHTRLILTSARQS